MSLLSFGRERRELESLKAALPFLYPVPTPWRSPPVHNACCHGRLLFPAAHCVPRMGCCKQVSERATVSSPVLTLGSLGLETSSPNSGLARHATISPCPSNLLPSAPRQTPLSERGTHSSPPRPGCACVLPPQGAPALILTPKALLVFPQPPQETEGSLCRWHLERLPIFSRILGTFYGGHDGRDGGGDGGAVTWGWWGRDDKKQQLLCLRFKPHPGFWKAHMLAFWEPSCRSESTSGD